MKYQRNREAIGQLKILGESFTVRIEFNIDCDNEVEIYHAELDTGVSLIDLVDGWMYTQNVRELLDDIVWNDLRC